MSATPPPFLRLPAITRTFLVAVMAGAVAAVVAASAADTLKHAPLNLLVITVVLCAGSALFEVLAPGNLSLALSGAVLAAMWVQQELLALLAIGPLLLMYRALYVPMLRHKTRLDPKTGLYNFEHFELVLRHSLREAVRSGEPVGVLMIDL